jgi:hypothetical protein
LCYNYHLAQNGSPLLGEKLFLSPLLASSVFFVKPDHGVCCDSLKPTLNSSTDINSELIWIEGMIHACCVPKTTDRERVSSWTLRSSYHFHPMSCLFRWLPQHLVSKKGGKENKLSDVLRIIFVSFTDSTISHVIWNPVTLTEMVVVMN